MVINSVFGYWSFLFIWSVAVPIMPDEPNIDHIFLTGYKFYMKMSKFLFDTSYY